MDGLIEAIAMGNFCNDFRIKATPTTIVAIAEITHTGLRVAGLHPSVTCAGQGAAIAKFNIGNGLINRSSGAI